MARSDDPSSRPVSKPNLKAVSPREPRPRPAKKEEKGARPVVQSYDSDFGVAMLIRGPEVE
jgi:hypothetical protein